MSHEHAEPEYPKWEYREAVGGSQYFLLSTSSVPGKNFGFSSLASVNAIVDILNTGIRDARRVAELERQLMDMHRETSVNIAHANDESNKRLAAVAKERDNLQAFKAYVHKRLDDAGVPVDPDSPHKAEGCRIGGRLDWVLLALKQSKNQARDNMDCGLGLEKEIDQLKQQLAAIDAGLTAEYASAGERSGDILDDFQVFMEHHKIVESERDEARKQLAECREKLAAAEKELADRSIQSALWKNVCDICKSYRSGPIEALDELLSRHLAETKTEIERLKAEKPSEPQAKPHTLRDCICRIHEAAELRGYEQIIIWLDGRKQWRLVKPGGQYTQEYGVSMFAAALTPAPEDYLIERLRDLETSGDIPSGLIEMAITEILRLREATK